jgi:hypothetical protein
MKPLILERRARILRDYYELRAEKTSNRKAFEILAEKYFLAEETVRRIIYGLGSYRHEEEHTKWG